MIDNPEHLATIHPGDFSHVPDRDGRPGDCFLWIQRNGNQGNAAWGFRYRYSYAIPTPAAIAAIAEFSPHGVIEMGAGLGYWAHLMRLHGILVDAYDIEPSPIHNRYFVAQADRDIHPWTAVSVGTEAVLATADPAKTLFLCWPDTDGFASRALAAYRGDILCYVGECDVKWPATGDDEFRDTLDRDWTIVREVVIPQLKSAKDRLVIYHRNP